MVGMVAIEFSPALDLVLGALERMRESGGRLPRASRDSLIQLRQRSPAAPARPITNKAALLAPIQARVAVCTKCPHLARSRTQTVFGVGNPDAELMFIGEAPGADEDARGEPFVGRAGQLLTKIIETMGFASGDAADDYLSSLVLVEESGAVGETQSVGRHAPGAGAIGPPDHRKATQIFHVERPSALDRIIFRTSPRGTFILRVSAPAPASRRSASVCAPIFAGKAVAKRTRRLRIGSAYSLPASIPPFAFSPPFSRP